MLACNRGHAEFAGLLLSFRADANRSNLAGMMPLHVVALRGDAEVADLLLRAGADKNSADGDATTARAVALMSGHTEPRPYAALGLAENRREGRTRPSMGNRVRRSRSYDSIVLSLGTTRYGKPLLRLRMLNRSGWIIRRRRLRTISLCRFARKKNHAMKYQPCIFYENIILLDIRILLV